MRLREFRVHGFRCIHDSGPVVVGDIAALVGKNESGKTALLEALTQLNQDAQIEELDLCDEMHEEMQEGNPIVEGTFEFSKEEIARITKAFPALPELVLLSRLRIRRKYKTKPVTYDLQAVKFAPSFEMVAEKKPPFLVLVDDLRTKVDKAYEAITAEGKTTGVEHRKYIDAALAILSDAPEKQKVDTQLNSLEEELRLRFPDYPLAKEIAQLKKAGEELFRPVDSGALVRKYIYDNFHPKLVYFSEYREIFGTVHIPTYLAGTESPTPVAADTGLSFDKKAAISNLFLLAGLDPTYLEKIKKNPQLRARYLRECSQRLTSALAKTWKTQKIEIDLDYGIGDILTVRVCDLHEDGSRSNYGHLSRRSHGFRWHFSFYVNFIAETHQETLTEAILLLDEPGMHLHPAQQSGMLDVLRELTESNQVLYTTHSPFMIYDYNVGAMLTVELDHVSHLSKISPVFWKGDPETILPILQVLGSPLLPGLSEPSLAPFAPPVVVVEGHTDLMYLIVLEQISAQRKRSAFRPRLWLQPAGGSARIAALAMFYFDRGFRTFALYDKEPDSKGHATNLNGQGFPDEQILLCDADGRKESDIEDLFTQDDYLRAVNDLYRTILKDAKFSQITAEEIEIARKIEPQLTRIVPILERIWESRKNEGWGSFDKAKVCARVFEIAKNDDKYPTEKSLNRFDALLGSVYSKTDQLKTAGAPKKAAKK